MANTVTIDGHPETTFGDEYRTARMLVSDETRIRIGRYGARTFRYEPTNIIPASAEVVMR